jgi:CheY-like chemotaxis protein
MTAVYPPARVLVADDDPLSAGMAAACLGAPDFMTTIVGTGADALELLHLERFDIALIDLDMPGIDGFRLMGLIKGRPGLIGMALLVVTCSRSTKDREEALRLGADGFLSKPVDWTTLPETVARLIDARHDRVMSLGLPKARSLVRN